MPTFLPMIPWMDIAVVSPLVSRSVASTGSAWRRRPSRPTFARLLGVLLAEGLDLHVHSRRQVELHQRVHRLGSGLEDVEEPPVSPDLELLTALLVHVGRPVHRPAVLDGGQR